MTESSAICQYLVERYDRSDLGLSPDHPEYGEYLNWLYQSDATLTFPTNIYLRFCQFEPQRGLQEAGEAYADWLRKRLVRRETRLEDREYLVGEKFTIADIAVVYALFFADFLGILGDAVPRSKAYLDRLTERPAFKKAFALGAEHETTVKRG